MSHGRGGFGRSKQNGRTGERPERARSVQTRPEQNGSASRGHLMCRLCLIDQISLRSAPPMAKD